MSKNMYLVIGHETTGSGSLTWPESFTLHGVFESASKAEACAHALNVEQAKENGYDLPDQDKDESDVDYAERVFDDMSESFDEGMLFVVEEITVIG